ncbi:hypothetical protein OHB26_24515 [Nocardia sp. NBC_01503]|uniref:hypothetical protein n=1 Tax=Nocardia sp. NBC_01503 TaxID=2975997 RepID=UPI002E7B4F82|nr:hypothetical protein [Nocardia sp. NBC_01503]WTL30109.1 hypothetical protein OHB26_24515 [Nocardia sp. NBC_01503]
MIEQDDRTAPRPPLPALPPTAPKPRSAAQGSPAWAQWLDDSATVPGEADAHARVSLSKGPDDIPEDPMAHLMAAARERAEQTRHRRQVRTRLTVVAAAVAALAVLAVGILVIFTPSSDTTATPATASLVPAANPPAPPVQPAWCETASTADRVSGSSAGDLSTGPGVILRLEYAWYVLRDASVVRGLLTPDAQAAPEQATRDAISAVPAGTQHCVSITRLTTDHWDVTVNELRPDGAQSSWQQIFTTVSRDNQVLISSIIAGGR